MRQARIAARRGLALPLPPLVLLFSVVALALAGDVGGKEAPEPAFSGPVIPDVDAVAATADRAVLAGSSDRA